MSEPVEKEIVESKTIKVWARIRPTSDPASDNLDILPEQNLINIHFEPDTKQRCPDNFTYDWSFKLDGILENATQDQVFSTVAEDIVTKSLQGQSGTLICYGQTGAGKTFTMTGTTECYEDRGLIPRSLSHLFKTIDVCSIDCNVTVRISYLEIYRESLFDLLANIDKSIADSPPLELTENPDGVYVKGLSCHSVSNAEEAFSLLFEGESNRLEAGRVFNRESSRSHCIFTISLDIKSRGYSNPQYIVSKLTFVDLAGSEKVDEVNYEARPTAGPTFNNRSLSFLEQVVKALANTCHQHVFFRHCKLTHYLKGSIGGSCNTAMIANIEGELETLTETMYTLRFATEMMKVPIQSAVKSIFYPNVCKFCRLHHQEIQQIEQLEQQLECMKEEVNVQRNTLSLGSTPISSAAKSSIAKNCRKYMEGTLEEVCVTNYKEIPIMFNALREVFNQIETDVEEKLKKKYIFLEKTQGKITHTMPMIQLDLNFTLPQQTSEDETELGETDGTGSGAGLTPKHQPELVQDQKRSSETKRKKSMNPPGRRDRSKSTSRREGKETVESKPKGVTSKLDKKGSGESSKRTSRHLTSTRAYSEEVPSEVTPETEAAEAAPSDLQGARKPPSRSSTFEEFKHSKGSEINDNLLKNKKTLFAKKTDYNDMAKKINRIKNDIDETRKNVQRLRYQRELEGPTYTDDGDIIISESEFQAINKLKSLKTKYHTYFPMLSPLRSRLQECENLVQQSRKQLLKEFEKWYTENFLRKDSAGQPSHPPECRQASVLSALEGSVYGAAAGALSPAQLTSSSRPGSGAVRLTPGTDMQTGITISTLMPGGIVGGPAQGRISAGADLSSAVSLPSQASQPRSSTAKMVQTRYTPPDPHAQGIVESWHSPVLPHITNEVPEDQEEFFNRKRLELMGNNVDSASFYNAKMRVQRRKVYRQAMAQPQLSSTRKPAKAPPRCAIDLQPCWKYRNRHSSASSRWPFTR